MGDFDTPPCLRVRLGLPRGTALTSASGTSDSEGEGSGHWIPLIGTTALGRGVVDGHAAEP